MIYKFSTIRYYIKNKGGALIMNEPNETTMAMGMRIQQARKVAKLTQMQFSEQIGVSTQYISDLERGVVGCSTATLIKICDTLAVSADYILRGQESIARKVSSLSDRFSNLSPQEQELVEEGFNLLNKAFSLK